MENGGDQLVTFFISIVLARLLGPEKYGTMATMLLFVSVANVIIQNGFQTALIQKKEIDTKDLSSVFWTGLIISAIIYVLVFLSAPLIAGFFGDEDITAMLRVLSLMLFFGAVTSVEIAIAARSMNFRIQCTSTIAADIISGIAGIFAAYRGLGTWALITQQLVKHLSLMLLMFIRMGWRPLFTISLRRLSSLFQYGWKVLASGLIDTIYTNIYTPFISKLYDTAMVGYYNRGNQFPQIIVGAMASAMQAVMLPAFSGMQDEKDRARRMLRRAVKLSSFIMFPMLFGVAATADSIVMILLGSNWLPAAPLLRLCCLSYSVWHIHVVNLQAINANGRSDIYLKLEIIKKLIGVAVLVLSIKFGITGMIFMKAVFDYICTFINGYPNKRIMGYGPMEQWKDILPEFALSAIMFAAVMCVQYLYMGAFTSGIMAAGAEVHGLSYYAVLLCVQVAAGVVIYLAAAIICRMESLRYLIETAKLVLGGRLK